jgi:hypothetical protein
MLLRLRQKKLKGVDQMIEGKQYRQAMVLLSSCFLFDLPSVDARSIDAIIGHNFGLLSRFGMIADSRGIRSEILPLVEGLLSSRIESWKQLLQSTHAESKVEKRQATRQREEPWVQQEMRRRRSEVADRLLTNRKAIEQQLDALRQELLAEVRHPGGYTFH